MKSLLGLSFYPSLSTGEFHENCRLFLTQIDYHADYTLFAKGYVNESHMETGCDEIRPQLPLIGHRRYYLELFTNDLHVNHPQKTPEVVQDHLELFSYDSLTKSRRIVSIDHCRENRLKTIRVLGLVQDKTRLFHYGERMQKNSFPFRFELTLRDATSDLKVTFWGQSCRYFHAIRPGQVIQLEGYEMKQNKSEIAMNAKSIVYIDVALFGVHESHSGTKTTIVSTITPSTTRRTKPISTCIKYGEKKTCHSSSTLTSLNLVSFISFSRNLDNGDPQEQKACHW